MVVKVRSCQIVVEDNIENIDKIVDYDDKG